MTFDAAFTPNRALLPTIARRLSGGRRVLWLLGASCTGKTTVCRHLAESIGAAVCDMDARIFGDYLATYTEAEHPASCAWLMREDAMAWALSLSWEEFDRLNEATNIEILDLFSREIEAMDEKTPLLVDGGLSHPSLLAEVLPVDNAACLLREEEARAATWERDESKTGMRDMVLTLPDGRRLWEQFRHFDRMIAQTLETQCREAGIQFVRTREGRPVSEAIRPVLDRWRI